MMRWVSVLCLACLGLTTANAAVVTSSFSRVSGSTWSVELEVSNDGTPAEIGAFTVFFSEDLYADLVLASSPSDWDSIVIEPDLAIPAAGFLDTFVLDPTLALSAGQSQGGFRVEFTLLSGDAPRALPFDIVDENFEIIESGVTAAPGNTVPEPASLGLVSLGLLGALVGRRRRASHLTPSTLTRK